MLHRHRVSRSLLGGPREDGHLAERGFAGWFWFLLWCDLFTLGHPATPVQSHQSASVTVLLYLPVDDIEIVFL